MLSKQEHENVIQYLLKTYTAISNFKHNKINRRQRIFTKDTPFHTFVADLFYIVQFRLTITFTLYKYYLLLNAMSLHRIA